MLGFFVSMRNAIQKGYRALIRSPFDRLFQIDYLCLKDKIMPKLYEYFGLIFLFYSQEHEPIHVHGKYQDKESKAEIIFENGKFKEIVIKEVQGKEPLDVKNLKKFKKIVELYRDDIVRKWIDFFVYNIEISPEKITRRI
jgi:hypothetical protein